MLFNTVQFAIFVIAVIGLYLPASRRSRLAILLAASLVFYTLWLPAYLVLLLADILVNYALLRLMVRSRRPRLYLALSVTFTIGLLAYFKYAALVVETLAPVFVALRGAPLPAPEILLPLGISFYSFQIIGLVVDTYRSRATAVPTLPRFALFVCFFPQLIAGPILRGDELLWQIDAGGRPSRQRARRGTWLVVVGLVKKVIFADFLLRPFVEDVFASPGIGPATFQLVALYAFTFQIYFDFAGYSDIARGVALFFGYELPLNFKEPYLSRDPTEYWRRWHITLSRWLRDYLYIPLGGNRRGRFRTYVNIMLTMLLGGLWHGASWNMVIWGGIHGVLIVVYRLFSPRHADDDRPLQVGDIVKIVVYFQFVCFAYLFFRAASFDDARLYLSTLFTGDYGGPWPLVETLIVAACAVLHVVERVARTHAVRLRETLGRSPVGTMFEALLLGSAIGAVFMLAGSGGEFIYFQF